MASNSVERVNASLAWKYFENITSGSNRKALCKTCRSEVQIPNRNTSNLRQHLKKHHWALFKKLNEDENEKRKKESKRESQSLVPGKSPQVIKGQPTLQNILQGKWDKCNPKARAITSKLTVMICKDMLPFNLVDSNNFKALINECEPRYQLPNRAELSKDLIPSMYREMQNKIREELVDINSFAFTTDMWTSRNNEGFISFTIHFINQHFEEKTHCLAVRHVTESHTALNLIDILISVLDDNRLDRSGVLPIFAVADNGRNIQNALRDLNFVTELQCFAHTLQLVIHDVVIDNTARGLKSIIAKCRNICAYFHRSSVADSKLKAMQAQLKMPEHKLVQDVPTRWNSTYSMLSRLIDQKQAVIAVLSDVETVQSLTAFEWRSIAEACDFLKPFSEITTLLSGSRYPTISLVIPVLNFLVNFMESKEGLNDLKKVALQSIAKRFGEYEFNEVYAYATCLDPRFKCHIFESAEAGENIKNKIIQKFQTLPDSDRGINHSDFPAHSVDDSPESLTSYINRKLVSAGSVSSQSSVKCTNAQVPPELAKYLSEPITERNNCPVQWWKHNEVRFPVLSQLARQYLGIPATTVESERLFSRAGDILTENRTRLKPLKVEMLTTLAANL